MKEFIWFYSCSKDLLNSQFKLKRKFIDFLFFSRELDPIFRICTPLRASEVKTTSKKILIPPSQLAKPSRQSKNSKNKGKQPNDIEYEQSACLSKTKCELETPYSSTAVNVDPEIGDQVKVTVSLEEEISLNKCLPACSMLTTETPTQYPSKESISPILPQVSASEVETGGNCSVSIIDLSSVCQIKPTPLGIFSSSNNHLLNPLPLTNSLACAGVVSTTAAQEVFMTSAPVINSSEPIILKSWPSDIRENDFEQIGPTTTSSTIISSPEEDSLPTIVVVNLDVPAESPSIYHAPKQNIIENVNSPSLDNLNEKNELSTFVSSSSTSMPHFLDIDEDVSPFPVLLTYVNDLGQPLSIPVNSFPQSTEDTHKATSKSVPGLKSGSQFERNVNLDHSYFQDRGNGCKTSETSIFLPSKSIISLDASVQEHRSTNVPSHTSCDTSDSSLSEPSNSLNGKIYLSKNTKTTDKKQSPISTPGQNSTGMCTLGTAHSSLSVAPVPSGTISAPMCVLNMDEMETIYTLPEVSSHFLGSTASSNKGTEVEDVTLELQLPVGCEILTMDMLSENPTTWDLPENPDAQVLDHKATSSWQTLSLGTVLKTNEPFVNSILSSALEPVVCNLALNNAQKDVKDGMSLSKQADATKVLSVCLDDDSISGLNGIDQKHSQELSKSVRYYRGNDSGQFESHENMLSYSAASFNKLTSPVEERIPLSPRSSKLSLSSQSTVTPLSLLSVKSTGDKPLTSCCDKSLICPKNETRIRELKTKKMSQNKNLTKGILNHVKIEGKQVGLENICKKVSNPKCGPSSVPGWFGKGLGLKKKRK